MTTVSEAATEKSYTRPLLATNAIVAWLGVAISFALTISGYYLGSEQLDQQSLLGNVPSGHDSPLERFIDWSTYFTIISNITVAIVLTVLVRRPALFAREDRVGGIWRALRLDSVLMIVITGIFYWLLLAEGGKTGWDLVDNTMLHTVTPIVSVVVWLVAGPRGLVSRRTIAPALVLPLVWAVYAIARGKVVGAYPYSFLDVDTQGLVEVLGFLLAIVAFGVVVALAMLAVDRLLVRRSRA